VRVLLDEMYSPAIAEGLRDRGHDVISVHDRPDLLAAHDAPLFAAMQGEDRVIVTNNVSDFMPLVQEVLQTGSSFSGVIFTSDRSLPRSRNTIGTFIDRLDTFMNQRPADDGLHGQVHWLTP
jgi:predicted nuclease of predicted toxin-antitoxin system